MFRNILVHIPSERPVRPVIDVAVALTVGRRAHLDAVAIGYESMGSVGMVAEGGGAAVAAVMGYEQDRALERANAAISVFEVEAKLAKIAYGTRALAAIPADAEETIGRLSRFYDLDRCVAAGSVIFHLRQPHSARCSLQFRRPDADGPLYPQGTARRASRRDRLGRKQAGRPRVRDALPFLTAAQAVTVIAVNEERGDTGERSSDQLINHLARRGIKASVQRLTADRDNVQGTIMSVAADSNIGLLVMGGFGHSRLQERILGGVTRDMFESMTVPVLMSH